MSKRPTGWYGAGTLAVSEARSAIGSRWMAGKGSGESGCGGKQGGGLVFDERARGRRGIPLFHVKHGVTLRSPGLGGNRER